MEEAHLRKRLGWGPVPQVVVDIFRIEDGKLAEHWDVIHEEIFTEKTISGEAMFSETVAA